MIHKTAIIDSKAKISKNVKIGPYSVIGPNVEIGENTEIHSHVNISGYTIIGKNNKIYPFASIGNDPQDLKYEGEKTNLNIGDSNKIREYVTINPGTKGGGGLTKIGNNCLFMVSAHIAHDCIIGNYVTLSPGVKCNGNVIIEAMVAGVPVLASSSGAVSEAITPGFTGELLDPCQPELWAQAVQKIKESPSYAEELRKNARAWVVVNCDAHRNAEALSSLFLS